MRKKLLSIKTRAILKKNNIELNLKLLSRVRMKDSPVTLEPNCSFPKNTRNIWDMGSFTYSRSVLPIDCAVGRYCSIGIEVKSLGHKHPLNRFTTSNVTYEESIQDDDSTFIIEPITKENKFIIENDVWIGDYVTIKPGITISNGAVIGAHSLVTKDVPPYAIVAGIPAKIIRYRFPQHIINELLDIKWWKYSHKEFKNINPTEEITSFIKKIKSLDDIKTKKPQKIIL